MHVCVQIRVSEINLGCLVCRGILKLNYKVSLLWLSVISVPEGDFSFDFVRHLTDWIQKARPVKEMEVCRPTLAHPSAKATSLKQNFISQVDHAGIGTMFVLVSWVFSFCSNVAFVIIPFGINSFSVLCVFAICIN